MEKADAVSKLKKIGYQVQFDSSVVTVLLPVGANTSQEIKKLRSTLQQMGYEASFGIRQVKEQNHIQDSAGEEEKEIETDMITKKEEPMLNETTDSSEFHEEKNYQEDYDELEFTTQFSLEDFGIQ